MCSITTAILQYQELLCSGSGNGNRRHSRRNNVMPLSGPLKEELERLMMVGTSSNIKVASKMILHVLVFSASAFGLIE